MRKSRILNFAACINLAVIVSFFAPHPASAKHWTIYQRQITEQARIKKGEKAGELTKKEADGLRQDMADIDDKIKKAKEKNGGKISIKDQGKIEKSLNSVTLKIEKLELAKRTEPR